MTDPTDNGIDPAKLAEYREHLAVWKAKRFRKQIGMLDAQISDDEAV